MTTSHEGNEPVTKIIEIDKNWSESMIIKAVTASNAKQIFVQYDPTDQKGCLETAKLAVIVLNSIQTRWQPVVVGNLPEDEDEFRKECFFVEMRTTSLDFNDYCLMLGKMIQF